MSKTAAFSSANCTAVSRALPIATEASMSSLTALATAVSRVCRHLALATLCAAAFTSAPALAASSAPIPVTQTAEVPVEVTMHFVSASNVSQNNLLYTVPAGKILVIDSLTLVHGLSASPQSIRAQLVTRDPVGNVGSIIAVSAVPGSLPSASTTQLLHTHVMAGHVVLASITAAGAPGVDAFVSMSGHLETAP